MAARLNTRNQESVREKIRATQLVNRLQNHVFGTVKLESTQVTAALGLLKKCVPDLTSTELVGNKNKPLQHKIEYEIIDPKG